MADELILAALNKRIDVCFQQLANELDARFGSVEARLGTIENGLDTLATDVKALRDAWPVRGAGDATRT